MAEFDVTEFPFVFFPVGLNLRGRRCLVIGDDREATEKAASLEEVGAEVARVADPAALDEEAFAQAFFVISTPQDAELSARLRAWADRHRVLLCCIDQPRFGFVAMQALVKAGPVRVAVSTGGVSPKVGKVLKEALQRALDSRFARFIACLNAQRERNRARLQSSAERRAAMLAAADGFEVEVRVRYPEWFERAHAGEVLSGVDDERLEEVIVRALTARGLTLATAESVTGGGIADAIVSVPGASKCFRGGVVAYDNAVKTRVLGVKEETLRRHGAVSEETAIEMARGACRVLDASAALAVTGIAGPTGATADKPVGLAWLALAWADGRAPRTLRVVLPGDREAVRRRTVLTALRLIRQYVVSPA